MARYRKDNEETCKLDEDFGAILNSIRSYMLDITSKIDRQLCKVWLEKLCNIPGQRLLRNEYLIELCNQLEMGQLYGIFSRPPPAGFLLPLSKFDRMMCLSSSMSDLTEYNTRKHQTFPAPHGKHLHRSPPLPPPTYAHFPSNFAIRNRCLHTVNTSRTVRFCDENEYEKNQRDACTEDFKEFIDEEGCSDKRMLDFKDEIMQQETCEKCNQLRADINELKSMLLKSEKARSVLKATQKEILWYYHNMIADVFSELKMYLQECNCGKGSDYLLLVGRLQEIIQGKEEKVKSAEKVLVDELKKLYHQYEDPKEFQTRDVLIKDDKSGNLTKRTKDEGKLQIMLEEQCAILKEVFDRMKNGTDLARKTENQGLLHTIDSLKKSLAKSERLRGRMESEYERKILNIAKNRDLEITTLQLQFEEEKKEMSTSLSSEKQCEVDSIVNLLEERYKTLLTKVQTDAEKQHQEDLRKIAALEDEVLRLKRNLKRS